MLNICPESEPAQELPSRAAPRVEANHRGNDPDTGRNSRGRRTKFFFKLTFTAKKNMPELTGAVMRCQKRVFTFNFERYNCKV